jgi:hypothetical protein
MKLGISIGLLGFGLASSVYAEDYPAAYFQPKIIYSATNGDGSSSAANAKKTEDTVEYDSRYPAANFQPRVIYIATDPTSSAR